jgi:hypothetical protein
MASLIIPFDGTEAEREAMHVIAHREGKSLASLIAATMREKYPEMSSIVEQIVKEGGPVPYHLNHYGTTRPYRRKKQPV